MESYKIGFNGKKFKNNEFKNHLYNFVNNAVTHNFEFDGEIMTFNGNKEDLDKISNFLRGNDIQIILKN